MSRATTQVNETSMELAAGSSAGQVVTGPERRLAVEHWLLTAAQDRATARQEWRRDGIALLRCGSVFGAIRISAPIVHAAAHTDDLAKVDQYLGKALLGGPVFMDQDGERYYVLVGASTGRFLAWSYPADDAEFLGCSHYLGVPDLASTSPDRRCYWCVEMDSMGDLTVAGAVAQLVHTGRARLVNDRCGG